MTKAASRSGKRPGRKGGAEGTRTPDPHTASVVRYQLRHSPLPTRSGASEPSTTIQADENALGGGSRNVSPSRVRRTGHPRPGAGPLAHDHQGPPGTGRSVVLTGLLATVGTWPAGLVLAVGAAVLYLETGVLLGVLLPGATTLVVLGVWSAASGI